MSDVKQKNDNAKNPDFKVPVKLPHVKPEDYDAAIQSGHGSARAPRLPVGNTKK